VAILRGGRLAATGNLHELLTESGERQSFEIVVKGVSADVLKNSLNGFSGAIISPKAVGATVQIEDEKDIDKILQLTRANGGSLVSVQPVKQSLEELFVSRSADGSSAKASERKR
jgi:ABC-type multidrug transport system ATPase subunit